MELIQYSDSLLSVLPPLVAVTLAITTRRVVLSLGLGILVGALLVTGGDLLAAGQYAGQSALAIAWSDGMPNWGSVNILLFLVLLGCLIALMTLTGGSRAFALWAQQRIKTRRQAKLMTGLLVFLFFIDDYFHSLAVGTICRPVTDRYRISRAKLAYLLDSTAAPVCVMTPVSSWGAYIVALIGGILTAHGIQDHSAFSAFITMIPMNFYALFTLLLVIATIIWPLDFGAMARHEEQAGKGILYDHSKGTPPGASETLEAMCNGQVRDLILPIVALVITTIYFMIASGADSLAQSNTAFSVLGAFENTNVGLSLVYGALGALAVAAALSLRLGMPLRQWLAVLRHGIVAMWPALRILLLAWLIAAVIRDVQTGKYLASMAQLAMPVWLLPAVLFILAGAMAFSTGTSWGTFGIMLPLAADLVMVAEPALLLPSLSAVLAGAVFGDHCSPISDTTILSSTGAASHHIDHVLTQLPYALLVASSSIAAYLVLGATGSVWLGLLTCSLWFALSLAFLHLLNRRRAQAHAVLATAAI
ncbi:Na+/H+ antiporter NhaC family protein [Craterilacuibacter sp.]|uniref:Na+/H+ antiporter NhaC family protein n=1 Tax=Craterilacuibacter sp. TaxID=2870909 RepID=UPI003F3FE769